MKLYPLLTLIAIALSAAVIFFFDWPKYKQFSSLEQQITDKKAELQSQKSYYEQVTKTENELQQYKDALAIINSALPEQDSVPDLLNFMQKSAAQSGLVIKQVAPFSVAPEKDSDIRITRVNIELQGDYNGLKQFLESLEDSARFIEVNKVTFSYPQEGTVFTFSLTITTYHY